MTKLDEYALAKALDAAEKMGWYGYKREIEETIRAYLAATSPSPPTGEPG